MCITELTTTVRFALPVLLSVLCFSLLRFVVSRLFILWTSYHSTHTSPQRSPACFVHYHRKIVLPVLLLYRPPLVVAVGLSLYLPITSLPYISILHPSSHVMSLSIHSPSQHF